MYSVPTPRCFYDLKQMLNLKKIVTHFQLNLCVFMVLTHSHYAPIEEMYSTYIKGKGEYLQKYHEKDVLYTCETAALYINKHQ